MAVDTTKVSSDSCWMLVSIVDLVIRAKETGDCPCKPGNQELHDEITLLNKERMRMT